MKLIQGNCLEVMKTIQDGSVDLVLCDPPYGTMKGLGKSECNDRTEQHEWDSKLNTKAMLTECERVTRQGGAVILFAQNQYTNELYNNTTSSLDICYRAAWIKDSFGNNLIAKKSMVSLFEDVLIFRKKYDTYDSDNQNPLRGYSKQVMEFIGKGLKSINKELEHRRAEHFFYHNSTQFELCTEKTYNELISVFGIDRMQGFIDYNELEKLSTDHKNKYPVIFNLPPNKKHKSNVLTYAKDRPSLHPTQKPVALLEDLIYTYSRPHDTVLDFCMGSGSTGVAAKNLDRDFIGIELDPDYFEIAKNRLK